MNARLAIEENKLKVSQLIETAERVSKVRNVTILEAIDYGVEISLEYAKSNNEKAAIEIRAKEAKKIINK